MADPDIIPSNEPITDVNASTAAYLKRHPWWIIGPVLIFVAAAAYPVWVVLQDPQNNPRDLIGLVVLLVILVAGAVSIVQQKVQDEFMRQFAAANGYQWSQFDDNWAALDGALFRLGASRTVRDMVTGAYLGYPIALFDYSFATGSGKSRRVHPYTVFRLQCDTAMPDLLLETVSSYSSDSMMGHLPEQVKLEGDFSKYFNLTIQKGYEVEALEIFTPDVMAVLMDKCRTLSLEIVKDHLFIYDNTTIGTKAGLDAFYGVARYFAETLGPVLARMKPALQAEAEVAAEEGIQ